jgi:hypothetical protein
VKATTIRTLFLVIGLLPSSCLVTAVFEELVEQFVGGVLL